MKLIRLLSLSWPENVFRDLSLIICFQFEWAGSCKSQPVGAEGSCLSLSQLLDPSVGAAMWEADRPVHSLQIALLTIGGGGEESRRKRGSWLPARHATSHGLLLPRVPSPFSLRAYPRGWAGSRCDQLHVGGGRRGREDQHVGQLHLQWIPSGVPADWIWCLLRWVRQIKNRRYLSNNSF